MSENFDLNKREFYNGLSLRYNWTLTCLPSKCPCGKRFDVDHAMSCIKAGFVHRRHDNVQDLFTSLLKEVCRDAEVGPHLQPLTGEVLISSANSSDEAHLDVIARGSWQRGQCAFFDARVFNSFAKSLALTKNLTRLSRAMRTRKTTTNELYIEVDHGSFAPLVFSPYGGNGREGERFLTELAQNYVIRSRWIIAL